eukprot:CAMPEP_0119467888 /NCGR_PEP_ID=MMETSP1344-20130328/1878_1 /TAXON_ID=236787 /ORGANISM="Florenciella parvula, Strain CCMP2471" /LENGTH=682 /DNA_ID=CAMNT_0007500301 /DNA_START=61 /DNA_END=2109 /DNA_ORIENTATION=+
MDPASEYMDMFSIIVPNTVDATSGPIRRNAINSTPQLAVDGARTVYEAFRRGATINPDGACLGWRPIDSEGVAGPYVFMSYDETTARIDALATSMGRRNMLPPSEETEGMKLLAVYAKNRPEWVIAEHACYALGAATVPLYDTLGADTVEYILNQTASPAVICGSAAEVANVLKVKSQCPFLRTIISMDPLRSDHASLSNQAGVTLVTMADLEHEGASSPPITHTPPAPLDVATFCYTSGTTGEPKGALITHQNLISACASVKVLEFIEIGVDDFHFSYLPLPHIFERVVEVQVYAAGAAVGFYQGDTTKLVEDLVALRPTTIPFVPRILNRIYDKITGAVNAAGGSKKSMFDRAIKTKTENMRNGKLDHWLWDRLLFNKIKTGLGLDRVRFAVTGSAPISPEVLDFFRCLLGINVLEGYGQTEGCAVCTITMPDDFSSGTVGAPSPSVEIKLVDVADMGYLHTDQWHGDPHTGIPVQGRGEICYRGPVLFDGYFKQPEKTAETFDEGGWLHSGDIGVWTNKGQLKIVDRKKNIFKLAQGEYVAAEKIENVIAQSPLIAQAFVTGSSLESFLVAVLVPDEEVAAATLGLDTPSKLSAACADKSSPLCISIMNDVLTLAKKAKLQGFEIPRAAHFEPVQFSVEEGLMTPTFKIKRNSVQDKYQSEIDHMYTTYKAANPPKSKL